MFTDPIKNLKTLQIRDNDIVADLGAGTGFYAVPAGKLAPRGKVYAVELQKDYLLAIQRKTQDARLSNVELISGDVEKIGGTKLGDGIADKAICSNILFQVEDKEQFIEETRRILKPGGKVLLVDWAEHSLFGKRGAISSDRARAMFEKKGFVFEREIDAGAHNYGMILNKL